MGQKRAFLKPVQNSRGMLTAEFLFSLVLCAGLCIVLFSLNFTLSMAEVAQYIAFSTSRAYAAAQVDQTKQEDAARAKYSELINNPVLRPLFNNPDGGWFVLSKPAEVEIKGAGPSGKIFSEYPSGDTPNRVPPVGVRFSFSPRLLNVKIPFLGSTSEDPDAGFSTKVASLLIREPTQAECWDQQKLPRYEAILNLDDRYKKLADRNKNKYVPMEDNGC